VRTNRGTFAFAVILVIIGVLAAVQIQLSGGRAMHIFNLNDYWLSELQLGACYFLAIAALNLALGYTGLFSFAHVSLFAFGAYGAAIAIHGFPMSALPCGDPPLPGCTTGLPGWAGILIGVAAATGLGALLALATFRARATTFAVVSLVLVFAIDGVLAGFDRLTNGGIGITINPPSFHGKVLTDHAMWLIGLGLMATGALLMRNLVKSPLGRALVAVRESEPAAASVGINPLRYRLLSLSFGGAIAGLGGAFYAMVQLYINPDLFSFGTSNLPLLFVVGILMGGAGTLYGPLVGVGILIGIDQLETSLANANTANLIQYTQLVFGIILFLVIVFLRRGIVGTIKAAIEKRTAVPRAPSEEGRPVAAVLPAPRRPAAPGPVLELRGVTKAFGGVRAVAELDMSVERGSIHGLIGPNGSGKTTTVNLITGFLEVDGGEVWLAGEHVPEPKPFLMADLGVGRVFQRAEVFAGVSSRENVLGGFHLLANRNLISNLLTLPSARRRERELRNESEILLSSLGLAEMTDVFASALPFGDRRLLEVARAMASRPTLLILDEPATGLSAVELTRLSSLLRRLREAGVTVLLIEHNMEFLMDLCDQVTVLDYGSKIFEGTPEQVQRDPRVIEAYLGTHAGTAEVES
jgi:ABC-type branched-subunit amino acid transport system ATPase component/ABC-type branched-subunit amino acid transport system permease subunit